ncbi:MAG: LysR family transcriptional regulator [Pseudomonadota bacterium]
MVDIRTVNLRHLRAFREVVRCRSVSQASERVHLSQPAITQAITKLEGQLDTQLFERRSAGMFPTQAGTLFNQRVDRALSHIEQGAQQARRIGQKRGSRGFANFEQLLTSAQLRALTAVADAGNFSLAARSVGISQPSLHRAARDLERLAGMLLFDKHSQGIALTQPARVLVRHAKLAFSELVQGCHEVEALSGLDTGRIVIGTMPLARSHILPTAIDAMLSDRPDVTISVVDGPYDDLLYGLRHGEIDLLIGALRDPPPIDDVTQEALFDDALSVVGRTGHPLAAERAIDREDLAGFPWIVPRRGTPTRDHFDTLFADDLPDRIIETSSLVLVRGLLVNSDRLTLISRHQIRFEEETGLLTRLDANIGSAQRPIGLTLRRAWHPTETQRLFLEHVRKASG